LVIRPNEDDDRFRCDKQVCRPVLGINESRVSQIHKSALEKMQAALQGAGIHNTAAF
jgi:hypothetical protein